MLYPRNLNEVPDTELFRHPTSEYRAAPFWAWNCDLDDDLLCREIGYMQKMGMGGFHMHTRSGMSVKYLSDRYMDKVRLCVNEARRRNMLAWLYDEDKWPSGFAGGYVTEKEENRQVYMLFSPCAPGAAAHTDFAKDILLARYAVQLDDGGRLRSYERLSDGEGPAGGTVWYARMVQAVPGAWFHFKGYVDTMNPAAIRDFIRITHEKYRDTLGGDFGTLCPAIFTDEPQMPHKSMLSRSADLQDMILPWTPDLERSYTAAYGESLLEKLPEVIWELPEGVSLTRYRFHDHTTERFVSAYCDQIGAWCRENGILMTGHMMDEGSLTSQTRSVGEVMRAYRAFTLPGVDLLCDGHEYNTLKQTASAAHQQGCPGMISELYGVTNWDFDFKGHKLQGDWQAALGVSVRVPHLYWCSMHGESKRDYPASIGHQSAWWTEYAYIEDHFARVNTLMTRGKPLVRIGVIHPIESYWISYGPNDLTGAKRAGLDRRFAELTEWLLFETLDFDFICESTLPSLRREGPGFRVGEMTYDVVIVPACETIRSTTLDALRTFRSQGGKVIFMGDSPRYMDAVSSSEPASFAQTCTMIPWEKYRLVNELAPFREIRIETGRGLPSDNLICAFRTDGDCRNLFISHVIPENRTAPPEQEHYRIRLNGHWSVEKYDTLTGDTSHLPAEYEKNTTLLPWSCFNQDSLLLRLAPASADRMKGTGSGELNMRAYGIHMVEEFDLAREPGTESLLPPPEKILLHEDNVCLLDTAEWHTDDDPWEPVEDMLRIGVEAKEKLGISTAAVTGAQPWVLPPEEAVHTLTVRSSFRSEIEADTVDLALEDFADSQVLFNGERVTPERVHGCFTDDAITRVTIGPLKKGMNTVEVRKPLAASSCTENMFILGDFGVRVSGRKICLVPPPETLDHGDWTQQGLPFYSGPLTYRYTLSGGRKLKLRLGLFSAPCVTLDLDGARVANLSLSPSEADLGMLPEGTHTLDITLYASRINSFGTFHLNDGSVIWFGPNAWRSNGMRWTQTYRLKPSGLLSEPHLFEEK